MTAKTPTDREFQILSRGHIRDRVVLANFREGLRAQVNPETGATFTEEEIQRATQPKSRWFNEAQAIDDVGQADQKRAILLADNVRAERANTKWLREYHAELWGLDPLPATGGSGSVQVRGVNGTVVIGNATLGDATAHLARDAAGNVYQVIAGGTISGGVVNVTMKAINPGAATNLTVGTTLTWTRRDPNMEATASVVNADFTGGTDAETDDELLSRLIGRIRYREGAGNDPQVRDWARAASNAIEDAFVYPTAFYASSLLVAITQKRGQSTSPTARIPNADVLAAAIAYLTPPSSPVFPTPPHVLVTAVNSSPTSAQLRLEMARGTAAGWSDARPFPSYHATAPSITALASQTDFTLTATGDATLPGQSALATLSGASAPRLMAWDVATSRFVPLSVSSVEDLGANTYRVILSSPPTITLATGVWISPLTSLYGAIDEAARAYFDGLGPRELFDTATDPRGSRCQRFPSPSEERPFRAGALLATRVIDALGGSSADAMLAAITLTEPPYPTSILAGPNMLTLDKLAVYSL